MAQDKKVFTGGMDKDSDPRLIKQGDYRDALNIRTVSSSDSTAGSVENIEGNTLVPYNFITESNQYVNVESGIGVNGTSISIENVEPELINLSQTIFFLGSESINYQSSFTLGYETSESGDPIFINTSFTSWYGNTQLTATSNILYEKFGPGGPLSSFNVIDINTGLSLNITASVDFLPGDIFDTSNVFGITFTSTQPGGEFSLVLESGSYTNESYPDLLYVLNEDYGSLFYDSGSVNYYIGDNTLIASSTGFSQSNDDTNVDDDGTTFGPGPAVSVLGGGIMDLVIEGEQPETYPGDPEITNPNTDEVTTGGVNIYSYDQTGGDGLSVDDYIVTEFLNLTDSTDKFDSGGEFQFGPSQDSISQFFNDAISNDKFGEVIIEGSNGGTTNLSSITTNFVKTTSLGGKASAVGRNNPDSISYSQLEFYFNSEEVSEGDGFSINEGTLTFSGVDVKAINTYRLNANILEGKNFKLDLTVSGLPSGNSFTVNIGNDTFGTISSDGTHSVFINESNNSSVIFLKFNSNFTSSDTLTLTNVRLFLEDEQVDSLTIRLASPSLTRFKLAFAANENQLRNDLIAGNPVTTLPSWYYGTSIKLINRSIGTTDLSSVNVDYQELLHELADANGKIRILTAQLDSITDSHNAQIAKLQSQLDVANSNLTQVNLELANALTFIDRLERENDVLLDAQRQLENVITNFIVEASNPRPEELVDIYEGNIESIHHALDLIAADLVNVSTTTLTDPNLQATIDALTAENESLKIQLNDLEEQISVKDSTIAQLNIELNGLQDQNSSLISDIDDLNDNISSINDEFESYVASVGSELLSASDYLEGTATLANLSSLISSTLDAQSFNYQSQINSLETALDEAQSLATQAEIDAAFAQGAASIDITSDNAAIIATAYADGAASVTPEDGITQANVDAAVAAAEAAAEVIAAAAAAQAAADLADALGQASDSVAAFEQVQADYAILQGLYETALANQEDGITQDNINAIQAAADIAIAEAEEQLAEALADKQEADDALVAANGDLSQAQADLTQAQADLVEAQADNNAAGEQLAQNNLTISNLEIQATENAVTIASQTATIADQQAQIDQLELDVIQAFTNGELSAISTNLSIGDAYNQGAAAVIGIITGTTIDPSVYNDPSFDSAAEINNFIAGVDADLEAAEDAAFVAQSLLNEAQIALFEAEQLNISLQETINNFDSQVETSVIELISDPTLNTDISFTQQGFPVPGFEQNFFSQSNGALRFDNNVDLFMGVSELTIATNISVPAHKIDDLILSVTISVNNLDEMGIATGGMAQGIKFSLSNENDEDFAGFRRDSGSSFIKGGETGFFVIPVSASGGFSSTDGATTSYVGPDVNNIKLKIQVNGGTYSGEGAVGFVIENLSVTYVDSVSGLTQALLETLQLDLFALQENAESVNEIVEESITDLSSGLNVISNQIQEYSTLLSEFNASSQALQDSINSSIDELGLTSVISQFYIDDVNDSFANNQATLDEDIASLTDFANYIQGQIDNPISDLEDLELGFSQDIGVVFSVLLNRATAVTNKLSNAVPDGISAYDGVRVYTLVLKNVSVFGESEEYSFGKVVEREHLIPDNRKNFQGTFEFWDSDDSQDGAPFQNIVKNTIKNYFAYNGSAGESTDFMFKGSGERYHPTTGYLLNPGSYIYEINFGGEIIPIQVNFDVNHGVDYTGYATRNSASDIDWSGNATAQSQFSIKILDNRDGWELYLNSYLASGDLNDSQLIPGVESFNAGTSDSASILILDYNTPTTSYAYKDFTNYDETNTNHISPDATLNIRVGTTNFNNRSIPQPQYSGTVQNFVRAALSDNYNAYDLDATSTLASSESDIIVNKSVDEKPIITRGVRRYVYNSILNKNKSISLASEDFVCIGSYEDKPLSRIYYFIHDTSVNNFDCILEYDLMLDNIKTVYQDGRLGSNGDIENVLNFDKLNSITGVSKVDDILYFTDNFNRPRKINVELGKKNEENIENAIKIEDVFFPGGFDKSAFLSFEDQKIRSLKVGDDVFSQIGDNDQVQFNGWSEVIGIVRRISDRTFNVTSGSNTITASQSILSNSTLAKGEFIGIMDNDNFPRFFKVTNIVAVTITVETPPNFTAPAAKSLNILVNDVETPIGAILTNCPFESGAVASGILMHANPDNAYSPLISFGSYHDKVKYLDAVKHQPELRPQTELTIDSSSSKNNILDNLFQFKYRYTHYDNENTSYSGISDIHPDKVFSKNVPIKADDYSNIKNVIDVEYFDTISDVKKIEIVARTGNDGEFVLVDTVQNNFTSYLKKIKNNFISDPVFHFDVPKSIIKFKNNGVYPFVDRADSNKLFDSVPKLAKAQTMLSNNRIAYGNVVEGFDNTPMVVESEFLNEDSSVIETSTSQVGVFFDSSASNSVPTLAIGSGNNDTSSAAESSGLADAIQGVFGNSSWDSNSSASCTVSFFIDLSGVSLNDSSSQFIDINLGWGVKRKPEAFANPMKRAGALLMSVDITGASTINQARERIIDQFNNGQFEGGASLTSSNFDQANDSGLLSLTLAVSGVNMIKVKWICKTNGSNNEDSGAFTGWQNSFDGFVLTRTKNDVVFTSGSASSNSFKNGAFHDFGVAYFDETNRCSFVNVAPDFGSGVELQEGFGTESVFPNLNGTRCYNPFVTEDNILPGQVSSISFNIYNRPPKWATHYQMLYAGNTSVSEFVQITIADAIAGDGSDTQIYLSINSLKAENLGYIDSSGALIDFDAAKGDRIRFISCKVGDDRKLFREYLDFEITGFDFHDSDNPISSTENGSGFYVRIADPEDTSITIEDGGTVNIAHSGSFDLATSGYNKLIAEIYRPKLNQEQENLVYYEIGDKIKIGNPGKVNRYHSGQVNQVPDYFYDKDVNTEVSLVPATVTLNGGDVYVKFRRMFTSTSSGDVLENTESFACEDYFLNDFHKTNHYDKGRINVVNNNSEERRLKASVFFSEPYVSTGAINGLSNFNLANTPYFDYNKDFGSIQYLSNQNNDLIIFHESKVGRVLVGKDILNTASGERLVSLSNNIISDYSIVYSGQYGCSLNPESIVKQGNVFYFTDIQRGSVLRLSNDGITVISEYGMKDYFRDLGELYLKYNPGYNKFHSISENSSDIQFSSSIVAGYDPKYNEYIVTFPSIIANKTHSYASESYVWSDSINNWDEILSKPENAFDDKVVIFNPVTVAFSEESNRWTSFYSYIPDYYCKVNRQLVTFKQGRLYRHNDSDKYSRSAQVYNKFYGNNNLSYIDFVFNAEPSSVKTYNALALESDTKFITGLFSNMGQYYGGYDEVISTNIAFKKVNGACSNDLDSLPFEITGVDTKFYEDLSPGDLIKIIGLSSEEYHIVSTIVSNNLIRVKDEVNINLKNNTMLVIDYKSKEGIQYTDIPFCKSNVDSKGVRRNFGDGSDIQGVGVVLGLDDDKKNLSISTSLSNSNLNKTIKPSAMINGASYVITNISNQAEGLITSSDSSVGDVITHNGTNLDTVSSVMSTNLSLYIKKLNGDTIFLGYPYDITTGSIDGESSTKILIAGNYSYESSYDGGFLFMTKTGSIEGERMKGSYMRTILATNSNQSKNKFNLYAANADVDKSELSNR